MDIDHLKALRAKWEANQTTDEVLAAEFEISVSRLRRLSKMGGWFRRNAPDEEKVLAKVSLFSFDTMEQQELTAAHVVSVHRKDVARLRTLSNMLVERLGHELRGTPMMMTVPDPADANGTIQVPMICRGGRESPADLLEKLSRVMVRTTEIERQAYGLKTFNPETNASEAELAKELDELTDSVETIARQKVQSLIKEPTE